MKRVLPLILALALCLGLLAGCGGSTASPVSSASAPSEAPAPAPEPEAPQAPETPAEPVASAEEPSAPEPEEAISALAQEVFGDAQPQAWSLPLSDGSDELTLAVTFAADKLQNYCPNGTEDFEIFKAAEEITGVQVSIRSLSTSASAEQFPIMIASGDYPDMVGWGLQYNGGNELAVDEGVYLDLTDIIREYAPNYLEKLSSDDELLESALSDKGYITNFFALQMEDSLGTFGPVIRTDLLEEAGLDKPYTIEEYETVLTAFKDMGVAEPLVLMSTGCAPNNFLAGAYGISAYQCTFPMTVAPFYTFEYDAEGNRVFTDVIMNNPDYSYSMALNIFTCDMQTQIPFIQDSRKETSNYTESQWESYYASGANADGEYMMPVAATMTAAESTEYSDIYSDIETYMDENISKFVTGDKALDEFEDFVVTLKSMNIDRCVELQQAAYDRYMAK